MIRLRASLPVLIGVLLLASGCERDTDRFVKRAPLPFGDVTAPAGTRVEIDGSESIIFLGWALSEDGLAEVNIYLDRQLVRSTALFFRSPDVARAFPAFAGAGRAGFGIELAPSELSPGNHELVVQARSSRGSTRDLRRYELTVLTR